MREDPTKGKLPARAGSARVQGFTAGLLLGFAAPGPFVAGALPAPKARASSVADDWRAVGADLQKAASRRGAA